MYKTRLWTYLCIFNFVFIVCKFIMYMNVGILSWSYCLCRFHLRTWTSNWIRVMSRDLYHVLNSAGTYSYFHTAKVQTSHNLSVIVQTSHNSSVIRQKGESQKTGFSRKQSTSNFPKNEFLTHWCVRIMG